MMRSYISKILLLSLAILAGGFLVNACSSTCGLSQNTLLGEIIITGNDPFTRPSLRVTESEVYFLECNDIDEAELRANQGRKYYITYSETKEELGVKKLIVTKIEKNNE